MRIKKTMHFVGFGLCLGVMLTSQSFAFERPRLEIRTGAAAPLSADGLEEAEMYVRFGLVTADPQGEVDELLGPSEFAIVKVRGDFSFGVTGQQPVFTYMDIEFVPLSISNFPGKTEEGVTKITFDIAPTEIFRNPNLDQDISVEVEILGVGLAHRWILDEKVSFFAELVGKFIGYRYRSHLLENLEDFHGASLIDASAQAGLALFLDDVRLRIYFGANTDIALGQVGGTKGRFSVHSDSVVKGGFALDLSELIRKNVPNAFGFEVYSEAQYQYSVDTAQDSGQSDRRWMTGFSFFY